MSAPRYRDRTAGSQAYPGNDGSRNTDDGSDGIVAVDDGLGGRATLGSGVGKILREESVEERIGHSNGRPAEPYQSG